MRKSVSITSSLIMGLVFLGGCKGTTVTGGGDNEPELKLTAVDLNLDGASSESGQVVDGETSVEIANLSATEYVRQVVIDLGAHFSPENICNGKTIFGRAGTAACAAFFDNSFRDKGMVTTRLIPDVTKDDDGYLAGNNVDQVDHSILLACGTTQAEIDGDEGRIADCVDINGAAATWDGAARSNSGHGVWKLVSKTADGAVGKEVWRDERTKMLWSDFLGNLDGSGVPTGGASQDNFGWCLASGNTQNEGGVDCRVNEAGSYNEAGVSLCAEDPDLLTPNGAHNVSAGANELPTWTEEGTAIIDAKGGMKLAATPASPAVTWKLPNREDFLQAFANGAGFVLPRFHGRGFWTASVKSGTSNKAWYFHVNPNGEVSVYHYGRSNGSIVRCVGR